jgi:hypothetical protein
MSNSNNSGGIGFLSLLGIVFIVLKLCNVIAWPWLWVLCPLWIAPALLLILFVGTTIWAFIKIRFFLTLRQREQINKIKEEQKKYAGKSKWQIRMEQMQEAQKLRENKNL